MRLIRSTTALVAAVLIAACSDPLGPHDVAGVYELERVGDDAVPAVLFRDDNQIWRVFSDTIILYADGTGRISGVQEFEWLQEGFEPLGPRWTERGIRFRVRSGRIDIEFVCGPNELCIQGPHIVALKTRSGLQAKYFELPTPLIYARVADAPHRLRGLPLALTDRSSTSPSPGTRSSPAR